MDFSILISNTNKMKWFKCLFIILFSSLLFSCSTTNVMRLRPVDQESVFNNGKQIVKQEKAGVKIVASYDGQFEKYIVFDVEVFNNTNQPITVSPRDFTFNPLDENKQNLISEDGRFEYSYQGIEPQQQINYVQHEMANQEAKIKRARVVNTVLFVGGIVALIAGSSGRSEGFWRTAQLGETVVQVAQVKRIIDHTNYYSKMDRLNREGQVWSQENFRTSILQPGQSMRGGVFLESNSRARFVKLSYKTNFESINFMFEQWFERRR
jgi:hypothetical protein